MSSQSPTLLSGRSLPQPDLMLVRRRKDCYLGGHPQPKDVYLIVEIAESSLAYDRTVKTRLYAKAGIPDYWIIDAKSRAVEVHRDPSPTGYRTVERVTRRGTVSPAAFPDVAIVLRELFPPA